MHALLLIAHGSRREASNQEIRDLASRLERIVGDRFDRVLPAFLELAEPDITTGVDHCVETGATSVTVVPYFLSAGRHVASDIPAELEKAARKHQALTIQLSDYLGKHDSIPELLLMLALDKSAHGAKHEPVQATG
ncbi:MAG: CbiX/SirB N-terminal domain-containing protein [Proteobacteria bacterium]|jgi:sirohydrochlorin ferrochelatase|nr:CbiX/SirB N-terminal domain-containing protein [Pseudomonadota bacterium]